MCVKTKDPDPHKPSNKSRITSVCPLGLTALMEVRPGEGLALYNYAGVLYHGTVLLMYIRGILLEGGSVNRC
jgi:hypothetical protein